MKTVAAATQLELPTPSELPRDLILASAGSGKTFRISSAIIGLLARGQRPDEIFASTFTRKAAGEILGRVLLRLAAAALNEREALELARHAGLVPADAAATPAHDTTFWTHLLEDVARNLHRVNIGTLDAFFVRTAFSFAQELGLPTRWTIASETTASRMRAVALQDVLGRTDHDALLELVRRVARNEGTRSVHVQLLRRVKLLTAFHHALDTNHDDHWAGFDALAGASGADLPGQRAALAARIAALPVPETKAGKPRRHYVDNFARLIEALRTGNWYTFMDCTLVQRARERAEFDRGPVPDEVIAIVDEAWELARADVADSMARRSHALRRLAGLYATALEGRRQELGAYEFDDITRVLGGPDPLGDRPDMYYRLDARAQHILLDEFQDTSAAQWEALEPLVDELMAGHEHERAAVIVADPKQSIYGWRGGTPDLIDRLRTRYALNDDVLAKSWRSSQVVLDFVNDLYARLGDAATWPGREAEECVHVARQWLQSFAPHTAARDLAGHVLVRVGPEDEGRSEARPRLCEHAAGHVAELHRTRPGFTIGVLTRTNSAVARMMMYLKLAGVHASEEGGNPLTDAAPVTSILALLRMADHPGHTIARYHVAHTPIGPALDYTDHRDERGARALAHRIRRQLVNDGYGATIAALAARIADACDARERRRLRQLVELAYRYEPTATLRPSDFVHYVRLERVEDPVAADVRVMTVHQAKGLEFDIVVLPELDASLVGGRPADLMAFRPEPGARIRRAFPYVSKKLMRLFPDLVELEAAAQQAFQGELRDGLSTMYVGLTRAKHALHVIIKPDNGNATTGARVLRQALAPGMPAVEGTVLIERGDPEWWRTELQRRQDAQRLSQTAPGAETPAMSASVVASVASLDRIALRPSTARTRALPRRSPSELEGGSAVDLGLMLRLGGSTAARRGSIAHRWLEEIGWLEDGVSPDAHLDALAYEIDPDVSAEDLTAIRASFHGWLEQPAVRSVLSRAALEASLAAGQDVSVEREVPFLMREEDVVIEGMIDRLVLTRAAGRVVAADVIDFKTDALAAGDADTLSRRTTHYRPQLAAYCRAVAAMYRLQPAQVTGRLVFVEAGQVVALT